jgi:hypothetical protein
MTKRSDMPKPIQILEHWGEHLIEKGKYWLDILYDNEVNDKLKPCICFACGCNTAFIQRAHIIAIHNGGNNSVDNLHLLCKECHIESEYLDAWQIDYYKWFFYKSIENSGSYLRQKNIAILLNY